MTVWRQLDGKAAHLHSRALVQARTDSAHCSHVCVPLLCAVQHLMGVHETMRAVTKVAAALWPRANLPLANAYKSGTGKAVRSTTIPESTGVSSVRPVVFVLKCCQLAQDRRRAESARSRVHTKLARSTSAELVGSLYHAHLQIGGGSFRPWYVARRGAAGAQRRARGSPFNADHARRASLAARFALAH